MQLVDNELAGRVLERALSRGGDFAELFCEERRGFALSIDESRIEAPQSGAERGAGVRVVDGQVAYFSHVDGLEADAVQKGASVYSGKLGERVAKPLLTAYDDGRLPGEWGTGAIDDEGTPSRKTPVIESGQLTSYLYDRLRARRDGAEPTGNGRRESFRHLPIPRMTNTYIAPGDSAPEEMISEVKRGFYAVSFAGGQVEPATGDFVFGVSEGYLIEGGKVTRPCRGATLIGNCLDVLARIDAVGSDFEMKTGFCGKSGQTAPVGTGQGHVRIRGMTVGGTAV